MPPAKKAAASQSKTSDEKVAERTSSEPEVDETEETPTEIAQPVDPNPPLTVEDHTGTERIIAPAGDGWEPAQVEPTDEQLEAAEAREKAAEEAKKRRMTPPEERAKDEDDDS